MQYEVEHSNSRFSYKKSRFQLKFFCIFFVIFVPVYEIVEVEADKFRNKTFTMTSNTSILTMKKALRRDIKKTLSSMSTEEKLSQSNYVTDKLLQHCKYSLATRVGIYLSLPDEIQTDGILKHMFHVGKICFIPRYNSDSMEMIRMNNYEEKSTLPKTAWNISQPCQNENRENALQSGGLDVLIVPGRAFAKTGCRLGRGKGYYDKYLLAYGEKFGGKLPYTIGLAFSQQMVDELPQTSDDIKLNEVICAVSDDDHRLSSI